MGALKKTKAKKPRPPKTAPPSQEYSIVPPDLIVDRSPPQKKPVSKPVPTPSYDCLKSDKELTFYLTEINGPASSKGAGPFVFKYAPKNVSWKKQVGISEYKTQGNTEQPLYFTAGTNKKLQLQEIIFDGHDGTHVLPHDQLNRLQLLQQPVKGTTKLRVFQLLVGNLGFKSFSARSYGKYVISNLDIAEIFRDPSTGLTLRAKVNLELTEVAGYQLDFGNDLAIPTSIVPTLPKELLGSPLSTLGPTLSNVGSAQEVGGAIPAGTVIAYVGDKATKYAHLHYEFRYKTQDEDSAVKAFVPKDIGPWSAYPKEILDLITLGPWQYRARGSNKVTKSEAKKLSELLGVVVIDGGYLGAPRDYRKIGKKLDRHRGIDFQLLGFPGVASKGTPIQININCFFVGQVHEGSGAYAWEGTLNGKEFIITIKHINEGGLAQVSNTANTRANSKKALSKGGTTDKANKKADQDTGD